MLSRVQGGFAAAVVTLLALGLVLLDLRDRRAREWWAGHALTTDVVAGVLVLLITLLVVDQLVRRRQVNERARAVGAQAAIVMAQASRASAALSAALEGSGERGAATDEVRTYMMMLLVAAPVLIEATLSRGFLEEAQHLAGEMALALTAPAKGQATTAASSARLEDAVTRLRAASVPLLQAINLEEFSGGASVGDEQVPG